MDYAHGELADRLAASYVAGTLRGPARRRFEALLAAHPGLRRATADWEQRLMPLTLAMPPQAPPASVWARIQARIEGPAAVAVPRGGLFASLGFWRSLAGLAVLGLAVLLVRPDPVLPPVIVVLSAPDPGAAGGTASFVASISGDRRALVTRPLVNVAVRADRALELWAIPPGGAPRSLGVYTISATGATVVQRGRALEGTDTLAVTVEPPGGSPSGSPTGPVVYAGKFSL